METYRQPQKIRVRTDALHAAVEILTTRRREACVVPRNYVASVRDELVRRDHTYDKIFAQQLPDRAVSQFENLHDSRVGQKSSSDLRVAYLAGPEPVNDLEELMRLGVLPHNIWAFEANKKTYAEALSQIKKDRFPFLKIWLGSLERFLCDIPTQFDIFYFDACGPIPSRNHKTLRAIATLLKHKRLASPGVLLTNFALPGIAKPDSAEAYARLVASYLYPKGFLERYPADSSAAGFIEGPESHGTTVDEFLHEVDDSFEEYYGQFVTRLLFDLGLFISPWTRVANSSYWSTHFSSNVRDVIGAAARLYTPDDDGYPPSVVTDSYMYPLPWTFGALKGAFPVLPPPTYEDNWRRFVTNFLAELHGLPEGGVAA